MIFVLITNKNIRYRSSLNLRVKLKCNPKNSKSCVQTEFLALVSCLSIHMELLNWIRERLENVYLKLIRKTYLENLVKETILVHELFLVYFVNFICNLYMFRTSPGPSSGGTTVFMRHLILVILFSWPSGVPSCIGDPQVNRITKTKCHINTVIRPDDGLGEIQNM